ncbi:cytochrome c [Sandarakinorhabdus sp. AAP62]|uniref:cytochrome c n=1 Tax=Sandarakinorhabdus sp. AAP62 TaxID=1248916 RepID=UPI0003105E9E|nr:cytochrome c [Sandarakinorhabdus sp. AAP62]
MRLLAGLAGLAAVAAAAGWLLTAPVRLDENAVAQGPGDALRGARIFHVGGCASCHAAKGAKGDDRLKLGGGAVLATPFGDFQPPNISPGADGIGGWSLADFDNAMRRGVSPDGRHYYPAFPYTSYARMTPGDIADLFAFLKTLPAVAGQPAPGAIAFPYNIRRGIGLWKHLYLDAAPVVTLPASAPAAARAGQYLVEGPGHCSECHTPRDGFGGPDRARWLHGGPDAEGKGKVPGLTPTQLKWSASEIADYLKTGFTPDYDSVGGSMVEVQANMAELSDQDRAAIAAYLMAVTP